MIKDLVNNIQAKYERYFSPVALLAGFAWDNITLKRIDLWFENLVMIGYLTVAFSSILVINAVETGNNRGRASMKIASWLTFLLQFAFGGLFSAFFIFYFRSSSVAASWPFLIILLALLVGNELFKKRYQRLTFQMSVFFMALFSYSAFALPILLGDLGARVFVLSGLASLLLIGMLCFIIYFVIPLKFKESRHWIWLSIGSIYLIFNVMYFLNITPPIPLSLKEGALVHSLERMKDGYLVTYEAAPWYKAERTSGVFHWRRGQAVYYFSAVFAPTRIKTDIFHRWSFKNEHSGKWEVRSTLRFPITGGRGGGYRGYTLKQNLEPGSWRVDVINERGQVLGRKKFRIVEAVDRPDLKSEVF
jgi:hypothetical protein